jgi:hypothetical protein
MAVARCSHSQTSVAPNTPPLHAYCMHACPLTAARLRMLLQALHDEATTKLGQQLQAAVHANSAYRNQRSVAERRVGELEGRLQAERQRHTTEVNALSVRLEQAQGAKSGLRLQLRQEQERHAGVEAGFRKELGELHASYDKWRQDERAHAALREQQTEVSHPSHLTWNLRAGFVTCGTLSSNWTGATLGTGATSGTGATLRTGGSSRSGWWKCIRRALTTIRARPGSAAFPGTTTSKYQPRMFSTRVASLLHLPWLTGGDLCLQSHVVAANAMNPNSQLPTPNSQLSAADSQLPTPGA